MFKLVVTLFVTVTIVTVNARPSYVGLTAYSLPAGRITTSNDGNGISTTIIEGPSAPIGLIPAGPALVAVPAGQISTTVIQAAAPQIATAADESNTSGSAQSDDDDDGSYHPDPNEESSGAGQDSGSPDEGVEEKSDEGREATEPSVDESTAGNVATAPVAAPAAAAPTVEIDAPAGPISTTVVQAAPAVIPAAPAVSTSVIGTVPATISTQSNSIVHSAALVPAVAPTALLITEGAGSAPATITLTGPAGKNVVIQTSGAPLQLLAAPNVVKVW